MTGRSSRRSIHAWVAFFIVVCACTYDVEGGIAKGRLKTTMAAHPPLVNKHAMQKHLLEENMHEQGPPPAPNHMHGLFDGFDDDAPELRDEDIAMFLEAQEMFEKTSPPLDKLKSSLTAAENDGHSSAAMNPSSRASSYIQSQAHVKAKTMNEIEKYEDVNAPPSWLDPAATQEKGGLPLTKPPEVPKMLPPPPPLPWPKFSYARPPGPYNPPPIPQYSVADPPPMPAVTWIPLAAYVQPPSEAATPAA